MRIDSEDDYEDIRWDNPKESRETVLVELHKLKKDPKKQEQYILNVFKQHKDIAIDTKALLYRRLADAYTLNSDPHSREKNLIKVANIYERAAQLFEEGTFYNRDFVRLAQLNRNLAERGRPIVSAHELGEDKAQTEYEEQPTKRAEPVSHKERSEHGYGMLERAVALIMGIAGIVLGTLIIHGNSTGFVVFGANGSMTNVLGSIFLLVGIAGMYAFASKMKRERIY
jgi:hypothetical protein